MVAARSNQVKAPAGPCGARWSELPMRVRPDPGPSHAPRGAFPKTFIQTPREQAPSIERFGTSAQLRARVRRFAVTHTNEWLLERHDDGTPAEAREHLPTLATMAVA
jgi:hypothetical protein